MFICPVLFDQTYNPGLLEKLIKAIAKVAIIAIKCFRDIHLNVCAQLDILL